MKESLQGRLPDLDELDLMIVRELERDARLSYLALASKLGASRLTVRRRLDRLVDRGIITIVAIPDHAVLGYETVLVLAINAPPGMVNTLARQFASTKSVKYLWITSGRYDIVAVALLRSPQEYLASFPEEIGDIPGNVRVETLLSVELPQSNWPHLNDSDVAAAASPSRVIPTELDLRVIRGLEKSPRVSMKELAGEIGASVSSVRSSFRKITSQGITRVVAIPNPASFGHTVRGITLIQVHLSSLKIVTDKLKVHPSVTQMSLTFGSFNCIIWTSFQNSEQMHEFLDQDLGNMPGVVHFENLIGLRMQKRSFDLAEREPKRMNSPE